MISKKLVYLILLVFTITSVNAQISVGDKSIEIDYANPVTYTIAGITVSGTEQLDKQALILLSGLSSGDKISVPGDAIAMAIRNLWAQELFDDVQLSATKVVGNQIYLNIHVSELPRLRKYRFTGINKTDADNIREDIRFHTGKIMNEHLLSGAVNTIKDYYVDKGFLDVEVDMERIPDSLTINQIIVVFNITKNKKVKIDKILIHDNVALEDWQLRMAMKETKRKTNFKPFVEFDTLLFSSIKNIVKRDFVTLRNNIITYAGENLRVSVMKASKYLDGNFETDKRAIVAKYNEKGYRDASIEFDTLYRNGRDLSIELTIHEGPQYYFGDIVWSGNAKYSTKQLNDVLGIQKGEIYDKTLLETRLFMNPSGRDISSIYMDDGYLFFQIDPIETSVTGNMINLEMRIYEGNQARINRVTIIGNSKTNDHVVMREIRTQPGQLFRRSDIIRTQRELAQLGYFNPETLNVIPKPNPSDGTVDIEYIVEEKSSDQIELSGGWGGGRVVGTLGVSFSNFSARNIFKRGTWSPLPSGDGQKLSIRAQSNGLFYQSYNFSFTEPWLGGRRPNALSLTAYHSIQSNGETKWLKEDDIFVKTVDGDNKIVNPSRASVIITGASLGLGRRLSWPDDYFTLYQEVTYQHYIMNKWTQFIFRDGTANNLFYRMNISRNSIDQPIYPRTGSQISLSIQATPPYSLLNGTNSADYPTMSDQDKYLWIEYHKWKFTSSWFTKIVGDLVLNTRVGFGYLGSYNSALGTAPLERFYLGGSGLTGFSLDGREIIALRGYDDNTLSPIGGASIINKYALELRYPLSLNPSATIYGLGFIEAGNTWSSFGEYNPFNVYRSGGVGVRVFLPMFGLLGLDYAWRIDDVPDFPNMQKGQLHFTIGASLGEL
ncbi:MAG: BamA/TamA family outer membrane protein [Flavobacteriales bacterium]|nr:BamA/TamA family outer membrane protein [Flavobacteriales bacterium]